MYFRDSEKTVFLLHLFSRQDLSAYLKSIINSNNDPNELIN